MVAGTGCLMSQAGDDVIAMLQQIADPTCASVRLRLVVLHLSILLLPSFHLTPLYFLFFRTRGNAFLHTHEYIDLSSNYVFDLCWCSHPHPTTLGVMLALQWVPSWVWLSWPPLFSQHYSISPRNLVLCTYFLHFTCIDVFVALHLNQPLPKRMRTSSIRTYSRVFV